MNLQDFLTTYAAPPSLDPKKVARALVEDPKVHAWLDAEGWGETTLQSLRMGGCLLFGEALVEASDGALHLYGIGYANELGDPEEGSYEHIVAYDPSTDRYLDAMGSHTRADLLSSYAPKAAWAQAVGEVVIEPFNPEQNLSIPFPDAALRARAASVARNARYGKGAKR